MAEEGNPPRNALSQRITAIEREVESNSYRAGPWARLVNEVRVLPIAERRQVAELLSRSEERRVGKEC